jgi:hypothetical protein
MRAGLGPTVFEVLRFSTFAAIAFAGGWWQAAHRKPPEDLSHDIVPHDS